MILKQDKGRGIVILGTTKYTEKCMALLNTEHFKRLKQILLQPQNERHKKLKKNLNSQSKNTKDYTQQAQHQLDFTVQPSYTS